MVCDTPNAPPRGTRAGTFVVNLTDDGMFGACHLRRPRRLPRRWPVTAVEMDRLQRSRWLRQHELGRSSEKLDDGIELAVVDASRIPVHQIAQRHWSIAETGHRKSLARNARCKPCRIVQGEGVHTLG